ncbi:uncharacterized protein LOC113768720 isoform X3 [Coffea eugenioides]|uniref:uncharacterized protein LOC113768720 isoform X3 n=1 Tax=Coffea eugenioides TaxID=49369 RepID=UPI000F60E82C|nr:uncharacterized protein LOC113768720 isoform X3 [Coffea eugenioides]
MAIVTGDRYLESLVRYVENNAEPLIEGSLVLKLNPVGLRYVQSRLEALSELESLLSGAPVDYLRAYISDLGDHRALEQLRRILRLLPSLKVVSVLPPPGRDPTPLSLLPFGRLKVLELRGCDLSTSAARGLLELRHTLEKLICHNSTDALRHVFASRIAEIKNSPQWNRLSFVSCACNGLLLMDESLQLLPAIDTLDLSRNKFSKVDNLRKCTKLKHLDLGFNHLRSIASFSEVLCQIVKLVLRNNALTTLRGIQNLKSLEGLDVSYNMISNFSEIEILSGLPSLQSLLLEGNPLCFARWYRPQVFSYFPFPNSLKLDEKKISTREYWKRQIIVAGRQKQPASFGFYSPAKDDGELDGTINTKRRYVLQKRTSRLASIESEDQSTCVCSDQDSALGDSENQSKKEDANSDEEEIADLMNRIEIMKKERSALWFQEFKEWMSPVTQSFDDRKCTGTNNGVNEEVYVKGNTRHRYPGESSRYVTDSFQASGDDSSTNILESDNSFADASLGWNTQSSLDRIGEVASTVFTGQSGGDSVPVIRSFPMDKEHPKSLKNQGSMSAIDNMVESNSSSIAPGSPPHYQQDILHRRQNLEEEFLQLSAESLSVASTDSDTSSEEDSAEFGSWIPQVDRSLIGNFSGMGLDDCSTALCSDDVHHEGENRASASEQNGLHELDIGTRGIPGVENEADWQEEKLRKKKSKRRVVSLAEEDNVDIEPGPVHKSNGDLDIYKVETRHEHHRYISGKESLSMESDDMIMTILNSNNANFGAPESCRQFVRCRCLLQEKSELVESEVAILSGVNKFYVLLGGESDGSVTCLKLIGCHEIGDVREVYVGLGLQVVRVCCKDKSYLFITMSVEKSRKLLALLDSFDSSVLQDNCPLTSLEQVQVNIFERHIYGSATMSIFQYSMVMFWSSNLEEGLWLSRSLFVLKWQLLVCIEDLKQFGTLPEGKSSSSYFILDASCSIINISEMVIDNKDRECMTLALQCALDKQDAGHATLTKGKPSSGPFTWKFKWFSEESLFKFVALLRAIHAELTTSPLCVRWIS